MQDKHVLGLELPTDPRWAELVKGDLGALLSDHAYCEQKAAAYCMSLIQQFSDHAELVDELAPIVTEEWGHFRLVLGEIRKRGLTLGKPRKDEYVAGLRAFQKKGGSREDKLLENLLTCALIEARSCERFRVLHQELNDDYLRTFYYRFMVSEAGHYKSFIQLAKKYCNPQKVETRWKEYLAHEPNILNNLTLTAERMH